MAIAIPPYLSNIVMTDVLKFCQLPPRKAKANPHKFALNMFAARVEEPGPRDELDFTVWFYPVVHSFQNYPTETASKLMREPAKLP